MCLTAGSLRHFLGRGSARRWACLEEATAYSKERVMFDRPIGGFQIQQVRMDDMLTEITKGQMVSLHLGRLKDAATSLRSRSRLPSATTWTLRRTLRARRAVAWVPTASSRVWRACVTWRISKVCTTYEGTHDVHASYLGQAITAECFQVAHSVGLENRYESTGSQLAPRFQLGRAHALRTRPYSCRTAGIAAA